MAQLPVHGRCTSTTYSIHTYASYSGTSPEVRQSVLHHTSSQVRSAAMLQAHGIIPRDRPSEPGAYHPHDYPLYMSGHAGPSSHYAHPPVKVEPRPLEERLGSEYYNDMQVEVRSYLALSFPFHCQMGQILLAGYAAFTKSATSATRSRAFCPAHPPARTCAPACSCA